MEIWKEIKGYEGLYEISNKGRVKSYHKGKCAILSRVGTNNHGYTLVQLCKNGVQSTKRVHQLVAIAFLDHNPSDRMIVVNHINFNRTDNRLENLEVVTARENSNKKHIKSSSKFVGVCWNESSNKWRARIHINKKSKHLGYFTEEIDAHNAYQNELKNII